MAHGSARPASTGMPEAAEGAAPPRVPVTLLTGFLGAGKTARLNATLALGSKRVAVIENELGALGVDGALVANRHDDGVIELANGCLCCSAEVDLIAALEALAHRRDTRPFEHVIIETTGLADVAPVVALLRDPDDSLSEDFVFAGVITVVDAACFRRWAEAPGGGGPAVAWASGFGSAAPSPEASAGAVAGRDGGIAGPEVGPGREAARSAFWRQIALADRAVISKADLAAEDLVEELSATIRAVNPFVEVTVDRCASPSPLPLPEGGSGGSLASEGGAASAVAAAMAAGGRGKRVIGSFCKPQKRPRGEVHLEGVEALALRLPADRPVRAAPLQALAAALLSGTSGAVKLLGEAWRVKGLVAVEGMGPALLQGVGDQVSLEPWPRGLEGAPFLVVIGEGLQRPAIEAALEDCCAASPQSPLAPA